ncbi:serine/threonine-protein kinase [Actinomycetes bacterium KLBMP 9759]
MAIPDDRPAGLLEPGTRISDVLIVDQLLGEGAFAEVYRVDHAFLGRLAMKVFKRVASLEETKAMLEEARLLSTLGHPNIVRLFDAGTVRTASGLRGWFTTEYVPGGTLSRLAMSHRPGVPTALAVAVVEQVASGLAVAHDCSPPIVHRDITPANILIGYDGTGVRARISDFGLARATDPVTLLASAQGTLVFLAPEVLRHRVYSCASDVWSVGVIAYLLLTNHRPYSEPGRREAPYSTARFQGRLVPPSAFNGDVDPELDAVVCDALAVRPEERPATGGELVARLRACGAPPGSGRAEADEPSRRSRELVEQAIRLARRPGELGRAADLLEEAVVLSPSLSDGYLPRLTAWRRGVTL